MVDFKLGPQENSSETASVPLSEDEDQSQEDEQFSTSLRSLSNKNVRHYKKDSRYLLDLYTLTFDEGQTLEKMKVTTSNYLNNNMGENNTSSTNHSRLSPAFTTGFHGGNSNGNILASGPVSLQVDPRQNFHISSCPLIETNLHKILARKIHDCEEMSFSKTKLLTKAYYQLLRDLNGNENVPSRLLPSLHEPNPGTPLPKKSLSTDIRIPWQTLISSDSNELKRIVNGLSNSAQALNEYLMELLIEREDLTAKQDSMLEEIGELTDDLV
eukprot:TRINITY_DN14316_c0_g1_i1.p1 TRINITY_DN14316_c0_g1~~TRINITY_DN14316_c0_g1_i1.p1  ORF type:complete len:270 (+),score=80.92 TRINITY_DN14316_c0_g1_i1:192-1001(+)